MVPCSVRSHAVDDARWYALCSGNCGAGSYCFLFVNQVGIYMPCYDIFRNLMEDFTTQNAPNMTPYVPLVAGSLARSLACISCYPVELARTRMQVFNDVD